MYNGFLLPKTLLKSPPFHHVDQGSLSEMWTVALTAHHIVLIPYPQDLEAGSLSHWLFGFWVGLEWEGGVLASVQLCAISKMVLCG